ncbi:unnamed protein product, partial [Staurois parvus]
MGRGHRPGSAGSKQRGTEGQVEGWSGASRDQSRRSQQQFRSGRVSKGTETGYRAQDKHNTKAESASLA